MRIISIAFVAIVVGSLQIYALSAASPAFAISADLAKKCRDMAIKAHPPGQVGTAYAQAERDYFRECIAKNGAMPGNNPPKAPPPLSD